MNAAGIAKEITSVTTLHRGRQEPRARSFSSVNTRSQQNALASDKKMKIFIKHNNFKKQSTLKIKLRERRPRKGRHGGNSATFATPSLSPLYRMKNKKLKN